MAKRDGPPDDFLPHVTDDSGNSPTKAPSDFVTFQPMGERVETVVDACERELRRWIMRGQVRPGERLPAERALAARLGVNRTTLRSALTRLTTARLVRVRQGSGYIVQDFAKSAGIELVPELAEEDEAGLARMADDLLRVRRTLLAMALDDLANRPLDRGAVAREAARFEELVERGADCHALAAAEHDLLGALLTAVGRTPVIALSFNSVGFAVRSIPRLCEAMYADRRALSSLASALVRCAEEPSAATVRAAMRALDERDGAIIERLSSRRADRPVEPAGVAE